MNISENIKKYRKMKGLTQKELADAIGVSVQAISKWECGATPDISQIGPLCTALGSTPNELLGSVEHYEAQNEKWFEIMRNYGEGSPELIAFNREVLKEYPNDELYGFRLATDLQFYAENCKEKSEAMCYYQKSKQQYEENLRRKPGDEVNLAQLVCICMKLGLKEEAMRYALASTRKDILLKHVYEGEELIRHNQRIIDRHLRHLIEEIRRTAQSPEALRVGKDILRAVFPDGNYKRYFRHAIPLYVKLAGEQVRLERYDEAMEELWQLFEMIKQERDNRDKECFTSPLFDALDASRDWREGINGEEIVIHIARHGHAGYLHALLGENGLFYPYLCDREDFRKLLSEVDALAETEKGAE